ncbi:MAG: hypothetical protein N2248_04775 [candidate division WOR-3 bacterium]|nr:hypothetical protein [candidate division WOR-3 bacterium]
MNQPLPDPDEEKARQILAAFRRLERQERARSRLSLLVWLFQLVLLVALGLIVIANLQKFKLLREFVNHPDSLLLEQPGTPDDFH